jgi:hypothetical protein
MGLFVKEREVETLLAAYSAEDFANYAIVAVPPLSWNPPWLIVCSRRPLLTLTLGQFRILFLAIRRDSRTMAQ